VSATLVGDAEQDGWKAAELVEIEQVRATEPAKPLVEVSVRVSELPVVAPELKLSEGVDSLNVKVGAAGAVTVTTIDEVTVIAPLAPVTVTLRVPLVPAVVLTVSTLAPFPPDVSVTEMGATAQVPAAVPLAVDTAQVRATVPENPLNGASAKESVLPVVAPAGRVRLAEAGVTENEGGVGDPPPAAAAAVRKLATSSEPRPVARS
jgi:hypothetical protein